MHKRLHTEGHIRNGHIRVFLLGTGRSCKHASRRHFFVSLTTNGLAQFKMFLFAIGESRYVWKIDFVGMVSALQRITWGIYAVIWISFYIQSIWLNMLQWTPGCLCVCLCVCACVCVISTAQTSGPILMKLYTNHLLWICSIRFSPVLKIQIWWPHGGHYSCIRLGHSHGRIIAPIFFKF